MRGWVIVLAALVAALPAAGCGDARARPADACQGRQASVVVLARTHTLHLCSDGRSEQSFAVSLGRGGTGKRKQGDERTPLGVYELAAPRPSADFGTFIPVGYPTDAQRKAGYTGSDVGIHGPKKGWRFLGRLADAADWTRGCVAVNRVEDIDAIASWVTRRAAGRVEIVDE